MRRIIRLDGSHDGGQKKELELSPIEALKLDEDYYLGELFVAMEDGDEEAKQKAIAKLEEIAKQIKSLEWGLEYYA